MPARRPSTHVAQHGVLQGYTSNGGYSDVALSVTTFQACHWTPAVGFTNSGGAYAGYYHNSGVMVWFK